MSPRARSRRSGLPGGGASATGTSQASVAFLFRLHVLIRGLLASKERWLEGPSPPWEAVGHAQSSRAATPQGCHELAERLWPSVAGPEFLMTGFHLHPGLQDHSSWCASRGHWVIFLLALGSSVQREGLASDWKKLQVDYRAPEPLQVLSPELLMTDSPLNKWMSKLRWPGPRPASMPPDARWYYSVSCSRRGIQALQS